MKRQAFRLALFSYNSPVPYRTLFFDLDDTLYPSGNGLWEAIQARMTAYMAERVGLSWEIIPGLRRHYYETYGTTLRGLQIHHQIDADDYLAYVHDLPLEKYIQPDPALRQTLISLPQARWIFTNADAEHARRVLDAIGLAGVFQGIIDIKALDFACKPEPLAYTRALALAGEGEPGASVLFDDAPKNLAAAHAMGFITVLVGGGNGASPTVDFRTVDLLALPQAMPELWEN